MNKGKSYSGTPLIKKLGIKNGLIIAIVNAPEGYLKYLGPLPSGVIPTGKINCKSDFIHFFTKSKDELMKKFPSLKKLLKPDGMLWISWPKGSSKIATDLTEDIIREIALKNGLVDVKVCAIDEVWSGLKLVYRLKDR
ncbi:MAG TPA: DUF3052 domain-containing protein [Ignavibacteria bacterium]|jgi:hypothetical protein